MPSLTKKLGEFKVGEVVKLSTLPHKPLVKIIKSQRVLISYPDGRPVTEGDVAYVYTSAIPTDIAMSHSAELLAEKVLHPGGIWESDLTPLWGLRELEYLLVIQPISSGPRGLVVCRVDKEAPPGLPVALINTDDPSDYYYLDGIEKFLVIDKPSQTQL